MLIFRFDAEEFRLKCSAFGQRRPKIKRRVGLKEQNYRHLFSFGFEVKKFLSMQDILAVGGRYDHLVSEFAEKFSLAEDVAGAGGGSSECAAVGVSISLDRLAAAVSQDEVASKFASADILICSQV